MKKHLLIAGLVAALAAPLPALASDLPRSKQSSLGLYMTSQEAFDFLAATPDALMIDVRTPEEITETGIAEDVDALIPLSIVNKANRPVFNPDFVPGIARLVQDHQLTADHPIVIICRSGNRSAQAADALAQMGFRQVYSVTDGFEGDRSPAGKRDINGWKNAGLPWREQDAAQCAPASEGGAC